MRPINICSVLFLAALGLFSCKPSPIPYTQDGNWMTRSSFNGPNRSEAVCFTIGDLAYLSGGFDGVRRYNDMWSFDPAGDGNWFQLASMPDTIKGGGGTARSSAVGFGIGQQGYVGTGYDGYNYLADFWQYDVPSNTWNREADFRGGARYEAVGFGIGNYGYITTGYNGLNAQKDFWQFDPSKNNWTMKVSMGGDKRYGAVAFVYNDKAYVVTGVNSGSPVNDFWMFDPSKPDSSSWTELRHITNFSTESYDDVYTNIIRSDAAAFVILGTTSGDKAYLTTGENGSLNNSTWEYDFAADLWKQKTPFEGIARTGAVGFTVRNRGFCGTGTSSSQPLDDVREFHPNEASNPND